MTNFSKFIILCAIVSFMAFLTTVTPKENNCGLISFKSNTKVDTVFIKDTIYINCSDTLDEWQTLIMAFIGVESENNLHAKSSDELYHGPFQMSEWYMRKASELTGKNITKENIHEFENALDAFLAMNDEVNPDYDIEKAIEVHNPGGGKQYRNKIFKRIETIKKYEKIRKELTDAYSRFE